MANDIIELGRLRRENQHFFLNGVEVSGIQAVEGSFPTSANTVRVLGMNCSIVAPRGPQIGSVSVSALAVGQDRFLQFTGVSGFNGYLMNSKTDFAKNYSFTSGYLTSYSSRASIGDVPQTSVNIAVFGDQGTLNASGNSAITSNLASIASYDANLPLQIAGPQSIEIGINEFHTNRVLSYDLDLEISRNSSFTLGSREPAFVEINWPINVNLTVRIDKENYSSPPMKSYPAQLNTQNVVIKLKSYDLSQEIAAYRFSGMYLAGESYSSTANGNVAVNLNFRGYLHRP